MNDLRFKEVGAAALSAALTLLPQWLGGKRAGHEWKGERRGKGGPGDSWSVNILTGVWGHFGGTEGGGDLISLYAALNGVTQLSALETVSEQLGISPNKVNGHARSNGDAKPQTKRMVDDYGIKFPPKVKTEKPAAPIPANTPPLPKHPKYGTSTAIYRYGDAFVVARYDLPDGKEFCQLTWRGARWVFKGYPEPKPIYKAEFIAASPHPILVVEGEKCADAARSVLGEHYAAVTWAGGSNAVDKSDWSVLAGRDVTIWPDADEPGRKAAAALAQILSPIVACLRVVNPDGQPDGWDIADAIACGWDAETIIAWMQPKSREVGVVPWTDPKTPEVKDPMTATALASVRAATPIEPNESLVDDEYPEYADDGLVEADSVTAGASAVVNWRSLNLDCNEGGAPFATLSNASLIIQMHPVLRGRIWFDSFRGKIYQSLHGETRQWTQHDVLVLTAMIQQSLHLPKFTTRLVEEAVEHAAHLAARNSLTDWLDSLQWDGTERLSTWLTDCLGVEHNEYSMAIARNWPIGMVARAYKPGCKMDNLAVLEGASGLSKTTFLEVLGDPWYKALPTGFGDKDFLQAIQGAWLIEVPDMTGFSRRDHTQILATITIRNDTYRASYGRYVEDHPRITVFAATSEVDDYLQDARGRRRYWPLQCTAIDIDALHGQREQVFAEAVHCFRKGALWYLMPSSADAEQLARTSEDLWGMPILACAMTVWEEAKRYGRVPEITSSYLLQYGAEVPVNKQTLVEKNRVARIMRENGWIQKRTTDARYWLKRP